MSQPEQPPQEQPQQDSSKVPAESAGMPDVPPGPPSAEAASPAQNSGSPDQPAPRPRRRILIGSQRDPAAYRVRPRRDWIPLRKQGSKTGAKPPASPPSATEPTGRAGTLELGSGAPAIPPPIPSASSPVAEPPPASPPPASVAPGAAPSLAQGSAQAQATSLETTGSEKPQAAPFAPETAVLPSVGEVPGVVAGAQPAPATAAASDAATIGPAAAGTKAIAPQRPGGANGLAPELTVQTSAETSPPTVEPMPEIDSTRVWHAEPRRAPAAAPPFPETMAPPPGEPEGPEGKRPPGRGRRDRREGRTDRPRDFGPAVARTVEPPSVRQKLSPELEEEFAQAIADVPLEQMIAATASATRPALEPESRHTATVIDVRKDDVFVELGSREQGILPLKSFAESPQAGQTVEVVVLRFNSEDGLYELALPGAAAEVGDWSSLSEGMLVEARITGYNAGGLECEVNRLRGFIPVSQVAMYRVENLAEFVEQKLTCLVVEVNPQRRRLVLSRRAVLERQKAEARQKLLDSLAPGQVHDGVVRKLMDFGAFVDLGGVDGLLHISQLSWGRVKHPSEVLEEGQRVRVRIDKIDRDTGKISLGYKDLLEDPWAAADRKYLPNTRAHGRVVKIMEFGALVELEPGVEGLIHISELSHKRVARVSDVLKEGEEVDVMVLAVDMQARRISLSLKNLTPPPEPEACVASPGAESKSPEPPPAPKPKKPTVPLRGGLGRSSGGGLFGLKW